MHIRSIYFIACLIVPFPLFAGWTTTLIDQEKQTIVPTCASDGSCDVQRVGFWSKRYRIGVGDEKNGSMHT